MLIRLSIQNFLSFAENVTFSMIPGKGRQHIDHVIPGKKNRDIPVLKAGLIYGANASGKSNLVKAIYFAQQFILRGTKREGERIQFSQFRLDEELKRLPTRIEFEIRHKDRSYAYGFEINNYEILEEWLYVVNKESEQLVFERKKKDDHYEFVNEGIGTKNKNELQFLQFTQQGTRSNQLFITECRTRNIKPNVSGLDAIFSVLSWFEDSLKVILPDTKYEAGIAFEWGTNNQLQTAFHEFLDYFNTGIKGVDFEEISIDKIPGLPATLLENLNETLTGEKSRVLLEHQPTGVVYSICKNKKGDLISYKMVALHSHRRSEKEERFEIFEESDGTRRIMDLIPMMLDLFKGDNVFVIDELDRSLHPNLTYDFIDLYLQKSKGLNTQIIVTTHESRLLSQKLVRKDEIWFVWKDEFSTSSIYSLEEFDVRFDKEIRKDYLLGRFKAVPKFGNRNRLPVVKQ